MQDDAMVRAHERAMERYVELRDDTAWRPDLGQRVADYHLGLLSRAGKCPGVGGGRASADDADRPLVPPADAERQASAGAALEAARRAGDGAEAALAAAAAALGLAVQPEQLPADGGALHVLELAPAAPALAFAGRGRAAAADAALRYLRLALPPPSP